MADVKAALDGARQILMETMAEDAALLGELRDWVWANGQIRAKLIEGKEAEGAKFRDYFDHAEALAKIPSHRLLALMRARNEGVLALDLEPRPRNPSRAMPKPKAASPCTPASPRAAAPPMPGCSIPAAWPGASSCTCR